MTFKEKIKSEKKWERRVLLIRMYHYIMLSRDSKWTLRKSACALEISLGYMSETLRLGDVYDSVKDCKNRKEALSFIKNIK